MRRTSAIAHTRCQISQVPCIPGQKEKKKKKEIPLGTEARTETRTNTDNSKDRKGGSKMVMRKWSDKTFPNPRKHSNLPTSNLPSTRAREQNYSSRKKHKNWTVFWYALM
ncbi:predicted protein [Plenodomus lingam JN3]|uniref:Uncharacterized protein n=1 Tax=Leptosphaeria maculans (strain JN3 / isolate v23.1.3 / race Av1-4-5-6-7-8) TaxID=985895 RepID=E4ZGD2_LEPMJ|nr:predicted protein [Plenodomus lingam JN3]CBX90352.1 predicted protein [Plenodomus lingam JN3]